MDGEELLRKVFTTFLSNHSVLDLEKLPLLSYPRYGTDLGAAYLELGQLPDTYVSRANGYVRKIREASGFHGLFQLLTGKKTSSQYRELPDGTRALKTVVTRETDPLDVAENAVHYAVSEGVPTKKVRKLLRNLLRKYPDSPIKIKIPSP